MSLHNYLQAAPKAELHVHLEGAIQPATVLELARRNRCNHLPADTVEGLHAWFAYRDFPHFTDVFVDVTRCLKTVEDYELIAYEFGAEMARQNVRYAEVTFSPSTHAWLEIPYETWFAGLTRGRERARADFGVHIGWIFDVVRQLRDPSQVAPRAEYTVGAAIDGIADGVVGLGLGGKEDGGPPEPFAPYFDRARAAGLHSSPHAGEHAGPESVWGALRALGAERIDHGVRSIEDPVLVRHLADAGIPLAVCPTSNICLGVFPDLASHPLRRLHDAGVIVTINSDDPPMFNTSLNQEVPLLADPFGFTVEQIDEILLTGVRASFLPENDKLAMEGAFRTEMAELKQVHMAAPTPSPLPGARRGERGR